VLKLRSHCTDAIRAGLFQLKKGKGKLKALGVINKSKHRSVLDLYVYPKPNKFEKMIRIRKEKGRSFTYFLLLK